MLNKVNFAKWELLGLWHSLLIFYIPLYAITEGDMWTQSLASFTSMMFVVSLKLLLSSRNMTYMNFIALFPGSICVYLIYFWVSNFLPEAVMSDVVMAANRKPQFYLTVLCTVSSCFFMDLFIDSFLFMYKPTPSEFLRTLIAEKKSITEPINL